MRITVSLLIIGAVWGWIFAQAQSRQFCTGVWHNQTHTCDHMPADEAIARMVGIR